MSFIRFIVGLFFFLVTGGYTPGDTHIGAPARRASKPIAIIIFVLVVFTLIFLLYVALTSDTH